MRILAIRGKNLASLSGEFEVDFQAEPLGSAGLFAITGPTGAGKSTLLDALCLALYERTPRLARASGKGEIPDVGDNGVSPSDPRTILRRGTSEGYAEVDFVGSDAVSYRARWSVRRSRSKSDGKLQGSDVSFMRLVDSQVLSDHKKTETLRLIEAKIGLNFDQFTRAVLLAQNEFAAFLRASDDERAELLQTLTGTETFTLISQQAFARMKLEKEQLERLQTQLLDQAPLAPESRAEKDIQLLAQGKNVKTLEGKKALEEGHLRWYVQLDGLAAAELEASRRLGAARAEQVAAAPRHSHLSTLEHVQSARPLCVELDRLNDEVASTEKALSQGVSARDAHALSVTACAQEHEATGKQLTTAETARVEARPLLLKARELDATVLALEPQWRSAVLARGQAQEQVAAQLARKADADHRLAQANTDLSNAQAWLSEHETLRPLAEGWPRWEVQFENAHQHLTDHDLAATAFRELSAQAIAIAKSMEEAQASVVSASGELSLAQQLLNARTLDCAAVDPEKLAQDKHRSELRREQLQTADQLWQQISDGLQKTIKLQQQRDAQSAVVAQSEVQLREGATQQPLLERDLNAAELSLNTANLAASKDAKSMRASLQADSPCPVCGATEHPYAAHSPQSDAILDALRTQVSERRQTLNDLMQGMAAAAARSAAAVQQIDTFDGELVALSGLSAAWRIGWQTHPIQAELADMAEAERSTWLADQNTRVKGDLERLGGNEQSYREMLRHKDQAQAAVLPAQLAVENAQAALNLSTLQQHKTEQAIEVKGKNVAERARQLADVQALLDGAFSDQAWRSPWSQGPQAFVATCRTNAKNWSLRHQQVVELKNRIQTLQTELDGCENACIQAAQHLKTQSDQGGSLEGRIQGHRDERSKLFDGKPTAEVESALNDAIELAKARLLLAQSELHKAQTENTRLAESVWQATAQLQRHKLQWAAAGAKLDSWIAEFNVTAGSDALMLDGLKALLTTRGDWLVQERAALQAIEQAVASGQAVLEEHRRALARHEAGKTVEEDPDTLRANLASTSAALVDGTQALTGLRIEVAQDDDRLNKSLGLRAEIDKQLARSRVWSQLSELIGSADGKKFRNFAQQLTLDILLGYANLHLQSLTRRYRLERITDSLGLLVVDQDMGDEVRSVHSLSGGESFLVSLALALGLASLSSHKVRVESLFIDEGFGSLDADSLRVAMDALDNLQALGRKVGVISHVQEMTERIGTRINVKRMSGGQSKVTVT